MEKPVVVVSHENRGATKEGTTIAFNPAHIVRAKVVKTPDGSIVATLHDVIGKSFQIELGHELNEKQVEDALAELFKLPVIAFHASLPIT